MSRAAVRHMHLGLASDAFISFSMCCHKRLGVSQAAVAMRAPPRHGSWSAPISASARGTLSLLSLLEMLSLLVLLLPRVSPIVRRSLTAIAAGRPQRLWAGKETQRSSCALDSPTYGQGATRHRAIYGASPKSNRIEQTLTESHSSSQQLTTQKLELLWLPGLPQSHPGALSMQFYFKAQSQHSHSML